VHAPYVLGAEDPLRIKGSFLQLKCLEELKAYPEIVDSCSINQLGNLHINKTMGIEKVT